jgi:photosystem II stability/assembly factor-like uncharacterized protein
MNARDNSCISRAQSTVVMALFAVLAYALRLPAQTLIEINPSQSSLWASDPDGASGGRVQHLAIAATNTQEMFAASEWGGVYKSTDGGQTWARMNGHLPSATWDVKVSPVDANRVIATSSYDGRVNSQSGINVSVDGGTTWTHPASSTPPANFCFDSSAQTELTAHGIAFDPDQPQNVYVGTSCGLAISQNGGATWNYVDPTPNDKADNVWAVVVHHQGIIDTCGDDGHRRSTDGGTTWTATNGTGTPLMAGLCSITASPDEAYVLFATVGKAIFESDNAGGSWSQAYTNPTPQGRIPFVKTNRRGKNQYDLWFGDVSLFRGSCTTPSPAAPGGSIRCVDSSHWAGGFTRSTGTHGNDASLGAHDDLGDIAFDPAPVSGADPVCQQNCEDALRDCERELPQQLCLSGLKNCLARCQKVQLPACPIAMSSDGGVFLNTQLGNPSCHDPKWMQPQVTPHALWLFGMRSAHAASGNGINLYFGNQDNGTYASTDAQNASPTWSNQDCCDSTDDAADSNQVLYTNCCFFNNPHVNRVLLRNAGMTGGGEINTNPTGKVPRSGTPDILDRFGSNEYVLITDSGVFITTDITANPISWSQLGASSSPVNACGVQASVSGSTPSFFVQSGTCTGSDSDSIFRFDGTNSSGKWDQVSAPAGFLGFGVFAVDRTNPNRLLASAINDTSVGRLLASAINDTSVGMFLSIDGGAHWTSLASLDRAMTANGTYQYKNATGPTDFTGFNGYAQPSLVAIAPFDPNTLLAAGADSGVFLSTDTGTTWKSVTDNSGTVGNPQLPRAKFASFDDSSGTFTTFLGTEGRGVWKFESCAPGLDLCSGFCTDLQTDPKNCTSCGRACIIGQHCNNGSCQCPGETVLCCHGDLGCRLPGKCPKQCP